MAGRGPRKIDHSGNKDVKLKIVWGKQGEWSINDARIQIGRAKACDICILDPLVSGMHAVISDGVLTDSGSTNGTFLNDSKQPLKEGDKIVLKLGDKVHFGDAVLSVEKGEVSRDVLSMSKRFPDKNSKDMKDHKKEESEDEKLTVPELMEEEFKKIIGHENIKQQLRQFHKKVQLDQIRNANGKLKSKKALYHMIFSGPPGTGKTTMANVVSKVMRKMKLTQTDQVVFVNNPLELIGSYVGQTAPKVDAKIEEARGGVLFIDEAYSIVKGSGDKENSFGREAIDTIMKHLDPPTCVFVFAGYEKPMEDFLRVNEGLARRIPYRYVFEAYDIPQLVEILKVVCESKGEILDQDILPQIPALLEQLDKRQLESQNAGIINNWVSFAQIERDDRLDIDAAAENPDLASLLLVCDFELAIDKVKNMHLKATTAAS